ncbi:hypothetical protein [Actinomadura sp. 3N407]|uniref:hypothetical protein n=1 Tax=Actinomadura sp. 3N407 TaxID=3457423 RepID=UPI003FCC79C2
MNPDEARASLDEIRRLQDRTRDEYIRQGTSRPEVLLVALGLFIVFASFDLPDPWDLIAMLLADGLIFGVLAVGYARASVRRKPTGAEVMFILAMSAYVIVGFGAFLITARMIGLPAPYTIAGAATALGCIASTRPFRRAYEKVVR